MALPLTLFWMIPLSSKAKHRRAAAVLRRDWAHMHVVDIINPMMNYCQKWRTSIRSNLTRSSSGRCIPSRNTGDPADKTVVTVALTGKHMMRRVKRSVFFSWNDVRIFLKFTVLVQSTRRLSKYCPMLEFSPGTCKLTWRRTFL